MQKNIIVFLFTLSLGALKAQNPREYANNSNAWFMYFGTHKFDDKWSLHLEAQVRRSDGLKNPQQLLLRGGVIYHINPQATFAVGLAYIETNPYGGFPSKSDFPEDRIWEQLQLKNQVGNFEWISRFRLEQRYVHTPVLIGTTYAAGDAVYTNRFRLLNRFSLPFKGKTIADKSFYLSVYDEFMINYGKNVQFNLFDQNRIYVALGYKIPKIGRLEVGYLNQLIVKSDGKKIENNNTLQVGLSCTVDFMRKKG
jgi:Protein of unknown function (DUF2490)